MLNFVRDWFKVYLNGQGLQDVDRAVIVTNVTEGEPTINLQTEANPSKYFGMHVVGNKRDALSVAVTFVVRERDMFKRADIIDRVRAWALDGGELTVDYRPSQFVKVVAAKLPQNDSWRWTGELQIEFVAYEFPYWQSTQQYSITTTTASDAQAAMNIGGTANTVAELKAKHKAPTNSITVGCETTGDYITIEGIGAVAGDVCSVAYDEWGYLRIAKNGEAIMHKRTAGSSDDITLKAGSNTIVLSADGETEFTIKARGRFT